MDEEKAAAYYDELTRKGEGAARFKQGLGFSSNTTSTNKNSNDAVPVRGLGSSLIVFVPQQLRQGIEPRKGRREIEIGIDSEREIDARRRRSRSRSVSDEDRGRRWGRARNRSRSLSPRDRRSEKSSRSDGGKDKGVGKVGKERNGGIDYGRLIEGYDKMSPAERVKAKMKLQLSETAEKDASKGMGSGWERFEFNKDAPLDDEELEAVEDDAALVKHIGQSFRFSAVEARREEDIKAAHDKAMFGSSINSTIR
ncbi:hypothetical protein F0562_024985 [Nyssa sinensis]|uniref:Uncharacterized protein n=1 Tax=Nyssa sinensis TaxID=561372 RepID=A0A5J5BGK4_9ASTE|nr:hypothetical protein F0562_024985 [Nyssa sinensis]